MISQKQSQLAFLAIGYASAAALAASCSLARSLRALAGSQLQLPLVLRASRNQALHLAVLVGGELAGQALPTERHLEAVDDRADGRAVAVVGLVDVVRLRGAHGGDDALTADGAERRARARRGSPWRGAASGYAVRIAERVVVERIRAVAEHQVAAAITRGGQREDAGVLEVVVLGDRVLRGRGSGRRRAATRAAAGPGAAGSSRSCAGPWGPRSSPDRRILSQAFTPFLSLTSSSCELLKPPTALPVRSLPAMRSGVPPSSVRAMSCQGAPTMPAKKTRPASRTFVS